MDLLWQLECLRARVRSLEADIRRVRAKDHPYSEPDIVYDALLKIISAQAIQIEETYTLLAGNDAALATSFGHLANDLREIAEIFQLADRVDSSRIPFEMLRALSWAAQSLLGQDCRTVVRLDPIYNYSIVSAFRRFSDHAWEEYWLAALREANRGDQTVLLLGFPSPDAGSILVHALAAHEFGHELFHQPPYFRALRDILDEGYRAIWHSHQEEIRDYVHDRLHTQGKTQRRDQYHAAATQVEARLQRSASWWIQELFADLVAARLVGPAFLAAFDRVTLGLGSAQDRYPSGATRRRAVRGYLERRLPYITSDTVWQSVLIEGSHGEEGDLIHRLCSRMYEKWAEGIPSIIERIASPLIETPTLNELLLEIEEAFDELAPPSTVMAVDRGIATADQFWLLMYAAWHFRMQQARFKAFAERYGWDSDPARAEDVIGNMVQHSLQALELRYRWNNRERSNRGYQSQDT